MAFSQISGTIPQYDKSSVSGSGPASGYYLKLYNSSNVAISMYSTRTGTGALDKCQLDSSGYPLNGSGDKFIPFVDEQYKIALYALEVDADADTLANADWLVGPFDQFQTSGTSSWLTFSGVPTYTSATTFTLTGDQTSTFAAGTNVRLTDASLLYGIVKSAVFTSLTTVTVVLDSGSLSASLSSVDTGISTVVGSEISAHTVRYNILTGTTVNRILHNRLIDIVSLKEWGPTGDGVTPDSDLIEQALTDCSNEGTAATPGGARALFIPPGVYMFDRTVTLSGTTLIIGEAKTGVIFRSVSSAVTTILKFPDDELVDANITSRSYIRGIKFDGANVSDYGVQGYSNHTTFEECWFNRTNIAGSHMSYGWEMSYVNCEFSGNSGDGIWLRGAGSNNDVNLTNCKIFNNLTGFGLMASASGIRLNIVNGLFEQNAKGAAFFTHGISGVTVSNCYFEGNANTGVTLTDPAETIKADLIFNGSSPTVLGEANPIFNVDISNNVVAAGAGDAFVYASAMFNAVVVNNRQRTGVQRLLYSYGNSGGSLPYGSFANVEISINSGFGASYTGTHTGSANASTLTDASATFTADKLVGLLVHNTSDSSYGVITANTATTVTAVLSGGTDSDWDIGDAYSIVMPEIGIFNMPIGGSGATIDLGSEFSDIKYDGASRLPIYEPDFNQWERISGSGGTWSRSSEVFDNNPNVMVWEITTTVPSTSSVYGFTINMDDYPSLRSKYGIFEIYAKSSNDPFPRILAVGDSDTPNQTGTGWIKYRSMFRFAPQESVSFGVAIDGAAGSVLFAAPKIFELGADITGLEEIFERRTNFKGAAAPTNGVWIAGDTVYNTSPSVGAPAAWSCTTAPLTFTAWANL